MNKIMVFGKPASGKSTFSTKLSTDMGIELYALDLMAYKQNGERVSPEEYMKKHTKFIDSEQWIIEGLGTLTSFWERIDAADTLIYIDLPYYVSYWWVAKRLFKSIYVKPEGWPEGSSVLKGTLAGIKYLRMSPQFWTSELFEEIESRAKGKVVHRITSVRELNDFAL